MDTEQALLRAIHEQPADRVARLALADLLEERGDPRAALMRTLEELRDLPDSDEREAKEARARDLLAAGVRPCVRARRNTWWIVGA